ncbi:MAG: indole-3-glycerol phosphate synthase TrpC [Patescibacteria group bacterium]
MNILTKIKINKLKEIVSLKKLVSLNVLKKRALTLVRDVRPFEAALEKKRAMNLIAEIKPKSPSAGKLIKTPLDQVAKLYQRSNADAISVLTDKKYFGGDVKNLNRVKLVAKQPILRKDFILDKYQVYESYLKGADAILLIVSLLNEKKLRKLYQLSKSLGLDCLVEVHNLRELKKALKIKARIIGINNRNLKTMRVNLNTTAKLIKHIPKSKIVVSESGIGSSADTKYLKRLGVSAVLVGTSILKSTNPIKKIFELKVI